MRKLNTILFLSWDETYKLVHLCERESQDWTGVRDILGWPTQDILTVICESQGRFLIGRFKEDYLFCPGDWDFLTKHMEQGDLPYKQLSERLPEELAGIKFVRHIRAYHNFHWLDLDEKLWWHFIPFRVEVEGQPQIPKNSKYSEFKLVNRAELPKFSRRGYLEYFAKRTLNVHDLYIDDFTTIFDKERGYYCFLPHQS
jgi:hypothetical protein